MATIQFNILNQLQTPAFYASSLATRPAFGFAGRVFIDTDIPSTGLYRDTGAAWVSIADPGAGTTGTLQQVTTNGNTTTLGINLGGILNADLRVNIGGAADNPVYALNVNGGKTLLGGDLYCFSRAAIGNSNTTAATLYLQSNDGSIPVLRSQATATENLFEGRNASATITSQIDSTGTLTLSNQLKVVSTGWVYGGFSVGSTSNSAACLYVQSINGSLPVIRCQSFATENLFEGRNASATINFLVSSSGNVTANSFIKSGGTGSQFLMADGTVTTGGASISGTYTPSYTNGGNTTAIATDPLYSDCYYSRVGNFVMVSGTLLVTPTVSEFITVAVINSLPIASTSTKLFSGVGAFITSGSTNESCDITVYPVANNANITFYATGTTQVRIEYYYTYLTA